MLEYGEQNNKSNFTFENQWLKGHDKKLTRPVANCMRVEGTPDVLAKEIETIEEVLKRVEC